MAIMAQTPWFIPLAFIAVAGAWLAMRSAYLFVWWLKLKLNAIIIKILDDA